jgi:hypothetical protein
LLVFAAGYAGVGATSKKPRDTIPQSCHYAEVLSATFRRIHLPTDRTAGKPASFVAYYVHGESGRDQGGHDMNFAGNFTRIGEADISHLKRLMHKLTPEYWIGNATRQRRYEVHQHTQTIALVYDEDFRHTNPTRLPPLQYFEPTLRPILAQIADHYEKPEYSEKSGGKSVLGYFIRASLVRLIAGGEIGQHQDMNFSLAHSHRVHVPIVTNDQVSFSVGNETIRMKEGEILEINNRRMHSVSNRSRNGRVHLILDWVNPGEQCCCADKTHPGTPCSPTACLQTDRLKIPCNCFPEN